MLVAVRISKRFGSRVVLDNFSFAFPKKGLVAIMGKSGTGKSTLLNILAGLAKPTHGEVCYQGKSIASFTQEEKEAYHRLHTSFLFQHYNLVEKLNVLDNVLLPLLIGGASPRKAKKLAKAKLAQFGLKGFAHRRVSSLSGGEKQRVALCRSLVINPRILFADEPTGALDRRNSLLVMKVLRLEAKRRLVIMVSHNKELVDQYADQTIVLGEEKEHRVRLPKKMVPVEKGRGASRWISRFLWPNLKRNFGKNLIGFCSGLVGFTSLIQCLGFFFGYQEASLQAQSETLTYQSATLSKKDYVEIEGSPLKLVQMTRPNQEECEEYLKDIPSATVECDYSYFLPSMLSYRCDGTEASPCEFYPIYDITLAEGNGHLIRAGEAPIQNDFSGLIVNEEFASLWSDSIVGSHIEIDYVSSLSLEGKSYEIPIHNAFVISAVVKEFSFLNAPRAYYSFLGLKNYLSKIKIGPNEESVTDIVRQGSPDSSYGAYARRIFIHSTQDVPKFFSLAEGNEDTSYEVTSKAKTVGDSFLSLSSALVSTLYLFLGIACLSLVLILAMTSFASFIASKKEVALLRLLGAKENDVRFLFCLESILVCFFSCLASLALSPQISKFANSFLANEFGIDGLIRFPYSWAAGLLLLVSLLIGFASSFVPLAVAGKVSIVEELRDE